MEYLESIVIGGGQAGLATSYYLSQLGQEHMIFEQADRAANAWRNERWDSFTLVTPNWTLGSIPGAKLKETERNGFMPRNKIVKFFEEYIKEHKLPVKYSTRVNSVEKEDHGFNIQTDKGKFNAKNVVIATGLFQQPRIPNFSSSISREIKQIPSTKYRNPEGLPPGGVLIIGSAQSGSQIAEELHNAERKVFLSIGGTSGRVPRRYRGKDIIEWLLIVGFFNVTPEQLPPGRGRFDGIPHLSGTKGGHTINLHQFAREGMSLLGHLRGAEDMKVFFAPNLYENLTRIDQFEINLRSMIDGFISAKGLDAPVEEASYMNDGFLQPVIEILDLKKENIKTIIWACGYKFDYSFAKFPIYDSAGFPVQNSGVTNTPGLYFAGLPWMPSMKTGLLVGVGESAESVAADISGKKVIH